MKNWKILFSIGFLISACEGIPDCAYNETCNQKLANLSDMNFSSEPYKVLTINERAKLDEYFQIYQVESPYRYPVGTVVVDTPKRVLYLIEEQGLARRYPIAVGKDGYQFQGRAEVGRMVKWPTWYPTPDMLKKNPNLESPVFGGTKNPLGARAIYLYDNGRDTLYRIHGNNDPFSIGRQASSGCIRMYNEDVIDLYSRIEKGTDVIVIGADGEKVDIIGEDMNPIEERELTTWEEIFYSLRNGGATESQASEKADEAIADMIENQQPEEEFDLIQWLKDNAETEENST